MSTPDRRREYLPGIFGVVATVLVSLALCLLTVGERPSATRAGQSLESRPIHLGDFSLVERGGSSIHAADLSNRVWIASFIFTRCPSSCPRISAVMKALQGELTQADVQLVSISVDPSHDTPEVLNRYAKALGADTKRWWFLTGSQEAIRELVIDRFKLSLADASPQQRDQGAEDIIHSTRLALVDHGNNVVGYFDADDPREVETLLARAAKLANPWASRLPTLNAFLNGSCAVMLVAAWLLIRAKKVKAHEFTMLGALAVSAAFLACYLIYHFLVVKGSVPFRGVGRGLRITYFTILLSHTVLAVILVPLVIKALYHAFRREFGLHRKWATITFPIWMYVSITGVIVYVMLYRMNWPV